MKRLGATRESTLDEIAGKAERIAAIVGTVPQSVIDNLEKLHPADVKSLFGVLVNVRERAEHEAPNVYRPILERDEACEFTAIGPAMEFFRPGMRCLTCGSHRYTFAKDAAGVVTTKRCEACRDQVRAGAAASRSHATAKDEDGDAPRPKRRRWFGGQG